MNEIEEKKTNHEVEQNTQKPTCVEMDDLAYFLKGYLRAIECPEEELNDSENSYGESNTSERIIKVLNGFIKRRADVKANMEEYAKIFEKRVKQIKNDLKNREGLPEDKEDWELRTAREYSSKIVLEDMYQWKITNPDLYQERFNQLRGEAFENVMAYTKMRESEIEFNNITVAKLATEMGLLQFIDREKSELGGELERKFGGKEKVQEFLDFQGIKIFRELLVIAKSWDKTQTNKEATKGEIAELLMKYNNGMSEEKAYELIEKYNLQQEDEKLRINENTEDNIPKVEDKEKEVGSPLSKAYLEATIKIMRTVKEVCEREYQNSGKLIVGRISDEKSSKGANEHALNGSIVIELDNGERLQIGEKYPQIEQKTIITPKDILEATKKQITDGMIYGKTNAKNIFEQIRKKLKETIKIKTSQETDEQKKTNTLGDEDRS